MDTEEIDLRGLTLEERKDLIGWFLANRQGIALVGELNAFDYLKTLEKTNPEFARAALQAYEGNDEEEAVDEDPQTPPQLEKKPAGYV